MSCLRKIVSNIEMPVHWVQEGRVFHKPILLFLFLLIFIPVTSLAQLTGGTISTTKCQVWDANHVILQTAAITGEDGFFSITYSWERSQDVTFTTFSTVGGNTFQLLDANDLTGTWYYRRRVDNNGNTAYSNIVTIVMMPSVSITGTLTVCQNATSPTLTITAVGGVAPYTITYNLNGVAQTPIATTTGVGTMTGTVTISAPTNVAGTFTYSLTSVVDANSLSETCTNTSVSSSATITVNALPTATITANTLTACENTASTTPTVTITGAGGTAPYTFTYTINGGSNLTVTSTGTTATITPPINVVGNIVYQLVSVQESSTTACTNAQTSSVTITVNAKPVFQTISPTTPAICYGASFFNVTLTYSHSPTQYKLDWSSSALADGFTNVAYASNNFTSGSPLTVAVPTATAQVTTYTGTLTVRNANTGCESDPGTAPFQINALPTPGITAGGSLTFCTGNSVNLTGTGGTSYAWSNGTNVALTNITTSGTFSVTVTNAAGCNAITSTVVTVNALPTPGITASGPLTFCTGNSVNLTGTGGTSYAWSNGTNTALTNITTSGTYSVTVTNAAGCNAITSTVVTVNALPTPGINASGSLTFCTGNSVNLTGTGGTSYAWSNGTNVALTNITTSGTYSVTVTNAAGCNAVTSTVVTVNALPTPGINASGPLTFCTGNSVNLTGTGGTSYAWSNGTNTALTNITTSGTYSVTVTNAAGCNAITSTVVTVNALPTPGITASGPLTFCTGNSVNLTGTGGTSYAWSNGTNTALTNITTSGTYSVTVTNAAGCNAITSTVVTVNALPTPGITAGGSLTFCTGNSVNLTGTGGTSYAWSNGTNVALTNITTSGTYSVTVTNAAGCNAVTSTVVTVNVLPTPGVTASGPLTFCTGNSVNLTGTGGTSYAWSNGTNTALTNITTSGTYSVTVTNAAGCNAVTSTVVTVNALPTPGINASGSLTFCTGNSVNLTGTGGMSYAWSNGTNTALTNIVSSGTYNVTVTNAAGCSAVASRTVTVNPLPTPVVNASGPLTFCAGNAVNLTASGGTSYAWSNGTNAALTNITTSGTYSVTITDANNCSATSAPVTITVNANPTVSITNPAAICSPGTVDLTASSIKTGSTVGLNYSYWFNASATTPLSTPFAIGTAGTYYIRGTNTVTNCSSIQPVIVSINPQAVMQINTPLPVCSPQTVDLTAAAITNGSATGLSYTYFTNAAATNTLNNANVVNSSGVYYIKGTPASGCSAVVPVTVTINPLPTLVINNPTAVCSPQTINLTGAIVTAGSSAGLSFTYFTNATLTTPVTNAQAVNGSGIFYIRATDATTGCARSGAVTVQVNAAPQGVLQIPATNIICENSSLSLSASGGNSYQWLLNQQPIAGANSSTYHATAAGNYAVRFISAQNCEALSSNTVQLELLNKPVVQFTLLNACAGVPTSFNNTSVTSASGGINWLWDFGDGSSSNQFSPTHVYNSAGTYSVRLTASSPVCTGFNEISMVTYRVQSALSAIRYKDVEVLKDIPITITARAIGTSFLWQPVTGVNNIRIASPSIRVNTTTEYTVAITNDINCTTTDTVLIKVIPGVDIYVPKGFTPNNDGQNDRLYPILVGMRQLNYFRVFNRWGNMIFTTKESNAHSGWNGLYLGVMQSMGTYTWMAEAVDLQGNIVRKTGTVLLLQ